MVRDIPADTTPQAAAAELEALRRLTPEARLSLTFELMAFMNGLVISQIRRERPGIGERDLLRELARRKYGREIAERAYPRVMAA